MATFDELAKKALGLAETANGLIGLPGGNAAIGAARLVLPLLGELANVLKGRKGGESTVDKVIEARDQLEATIRRQARDEANRLDPGQD